MIALRVPVRVSRDPRYFQIVSLLLLCIYGIASLDFPVSCVQVCLILTPSLLTQWVFGKYFRLKNFDFRSPLISGSSLYLLLRTGSCWVAGLGAVIAIGSNNQNLAGRRPRPKDVFVTRLHVMYDADHFPDDLRFQETGDRSNFQGRYMMFHPWKGDPEACDQVRSYFKSLPERLENEAQTLGKLTGWDIVDIRRKMEKNSRSTSFSCINMDESWVDRL